jgi:hypothetical protein
VADGLLMITLALHLDHRLAPGEDLALANAVAAILARPCFGALSRVAINVKDRDKGHQPKTAAAIAESLLAPDSDAAVLDNGRKGDLIASAHVWTGRHIKTYDDPKPFLKSHVVIPYDPAAREACIGAFVDLASALEAVAGYVAVEKNHSRGQAAAISQAPRPEDVRDYPRRAQERKGHYWYDKEVGFQVSGPDWGLILGPGHLPQVPDLSVFPLVKDAGSAKLVFLSEDPEDALRETFDERLEAARRALAPVLMDVSAVPVG